MRPIIFDLINWVIAKTMDFVLEIFRKSEHLKYNQWLAIDNINCDNILNYSTICNKWQAHFLVDSEETFHLCCWRKLFHLQPQNHSPYLCTTILNPGEKRGKMTRRWNYEEEHFKIIQTCKYEKTGKHHTDEVLHVKLLILCMKMYKIITK